MAKSASVSALALFVLLIPPSRAQDAAGGIRVRVGVPYVARGPGAVADSWFTEIKLPDGRYRGFTALGSTLAIDGKEAPPRAEVRRCARACARRSIRR